MAYADFAYWYDALNEEADYDSLSAQLVRRLAGNGVGEGIIADLGCGTGEVSLRLAQAGYDMIAVDRSADMLSIFREKLYEAGLHSNVLVLQQGLEELDLFGTIRAAVSTFDTLNHLSQKELVEAIRRVSLFTEPGGLFIFDANTPYKHETVLENSEFVIEAEDDVACVWQNRYLPQQQATQISIEVRQAGEMLFQESFMEYVYTQAFWEQTLADAGYRLLEVCDGESFGPLTATSQRYLFTAQKYDLI